MVYYLALVLVIIKYIISLCPGDLENEIHENEIHENVRISEKVYKIYVCQKRTMKSMNISVQA